jgi:hypothetical protein
MSGLREAELNDEQRRALARLRAREVERAAEEQVRHLVGRSGGCSCPPTFIVPGEERPVQPSCGLPGHGASITFVIPRPG